MFYVCFIVTILSSKPTNTVECSIIGEQQLLSEIATCKRIDETDPVTTCNVSKIREKAYDFHIGVVR